MKKIALTAAAALLVSAGAAFAAGSDHFGSDGADQSAVNVDSSYTASIGPAATQDNGHVHKPVTDGAPRLGGNS